MFYIIYFINNTSYANDNKIILTQKIEKVQTYPFTNWYSNGQIKGICHFKNQTSVKCQPLLLHGKVTEWYSNGVKKAEGNWSNSYEKGEFTWWYPNGQKRLSGFCNTNAIGLWKQWDISGEILRKGYYKNEKRIGVWKTIISNSVFKCIFKNGKPWNGLWHINKFKTTNGAQNVKGVWEKQYYINGNPQ